MAKTGLSNELEELFSSVADDLGWLNIDETLKDLEHEVSKNSKIKSPKDGKRKIRKQKNNKVKTSRRKKKSGGSGDDTSQVANQNKGGDTLSGISDKLKSKIIADRPSIKTSKTSCAPQEEEDVIIIDDDEDECEDNACTIEQTQEVVNNKRKTLRRKKKLTNHHKSDNPLSNTGADKLNGENTSDQTSMKPSNPPFTPEKEDVTIINDEEYVENVCIGMQTVNKQNRGSSEQCKKGLGETISTKISGIDVSYSSVHNDLDSIANGNTSDDDANKVQPSDANNPVSSRLQHSHKVVEENRMHETAITGSDNENADNQIQCGTYQDAIDANDLQDVLDNHDDCKDKQRNAVPDDPSEDESHCNDDHSEDSDTIPEQTPPFLTLTERLKKNHKHQKEKKGDSSESHGHSRVEEKSVRRKEKTRFRDGEVPSSKKNYDDQSSFTSYRDVETSARKYASDSSSDDDKFESFLASIKSTSQTPAKPPPTQEDMDDFIADDDEPIVISSGEENEEEDEIFYYQCDNAETPVFTNEDEQSGNSTVYMSFRSDSVDPEKENFVTPATHPHSSSQNIFKKPKSSNTKPAPNVNSILSDSDDDSFTTPSWHPTTSTKNTTKLPDTDSSLKHWDVKPAKVPIKTKPLSTILHGLASDESDGDDSVFTTPIIRPPLKTKKPPNTLSAKPSRPPVINYHKLQELKRRSTPTFLGSLATPPKGESSSSPYVRDFKKKKEELTRKLVKLYNETVFDNKLPSDLSVTWNKRLRKTAGYCYYSKSKIGENRHSRIELSDKVCDTAERLRDTLIHEMCHAAAWLVNGVHDGHGRYWKYWAAKANIAHPEIPIIKRCHSYEINTKYKYQCTRCHTTIGRHSKSINTDKFCCAYCKGQLILLPTVNQDGTPVKARTPNKFALFVKENYASVKKENTQMKHADIMRLLSRDFANKAKIVQ